MKSETKTLKISYFRLSLLFTYFTYSWNVLFSSKNSHFCIQMYAKHLHPEGTSVEFCLFETFKMFWHGGQWEILFSIINLYTTNTFISKILLYMHIFYEEHLSYIRIFLIVGDGSNISWFSKIWQAGNLWISEPFLFILEKFKHTSSSDVLFMIENRISCRPP